MVVNMICKFAFLSPEIIHETIESNLLNQYLLQNMHKRFENFKIFLGDREKGRSELLGCNCKLKWKKKRYTHSNKFIQYKTFLI